MKLKDIYTEDELQALDPELSMVDERDEVNPSKENKTFMEFVASNEPIPMNLTLSDGTLIKTSSDLEEFDPDDLDEADVEKINQIIRKYLGDDAYWSSSDEILLGDSTSDMFIRKDGKIVGAVDYVNDEVFYLDEDNKFKSLNEALIDEALDFMNV